MSQTKSQSVIGRAEEVGFPELGVFAVPARIDTGAKTSALWVSNVREQDGVLYFTLFGEGSPLYTGAELAVKEYGLRDVTSSNGARQQRYLVRFLVTLGGNRKIRASFTLADRSTQIYPVLIGRNVLHGKFIVDVQLGRPLVQEVVAPELSQDPEGEENV